MIKGCKLKLGISFAGGGVKGAAHIGVLKALEEENIKFDFVSGTSSGSIVATLASVGFDAKEIYQLFQKYCKKIKYVDVKRIIKGVIGLIVERKIIIDGLNDGAIIEKIINQACYDKNITNIKQINKLLMIPAIDLNNGKMYVFSSKENRETYSNDIIYVNDINIGKAVRASCSYPGVFSPCKYQNTKLIDGGIRENIPWKIIKNYGADKVISVIFEKEIDKNGNTNNIIDVVSRSLDILSYELSNYELAGTDYILKIKTKNINLLDIKYIDHLYKLGYETAKRNMKQIKKLIYN